MADNPYINKVVYGDQTLIDLTEDTVSPSSLKLGNTAHDASGAQITGTADDAPKRTIAYIFSETDSYSVSDYVYYENQLYKCTTAHTGTWNAEHFTETTIGNELNSKLSGLTILSYGNSTWNDFIAAYTANRVVYCRASSNSNPASGSQTRLAFMAYVSNADNPTNVEFQYYRSVATHTASQQGDQVFVYKLDKSAGWSVTTRNAFTKIVAGTNMSSSYSNGTITLNADASGTSDGNGAPKRTIAYIFSEIDTYAVNDYVYYENQLYICVTAHTGAWNAQHFTLTTVGDELNDKAPKDYIVVQDEEPTNQDTKLWINDQDDNGEEIEVYTSDEVDNKLASKADKNYICNRNLLDNWYFVGGGSQLGYGKFPINQRGQGSYLGPGYGIDRWSCATSSVTALCGYSNYIVLKSSTAGSQNLLIQYIDNKELLAGKTVTISAMINSTLVQSTISIPADSSTWGSTIGSGSASVGGCAIYLRYLNSKLCFVFYASSMYVANTNILISSAKLELNSYQTLAHNEGTESSPNWVLNEIPDYGEELEKCRRYLFIVTSSSASGPVGSGYCPSDGQTATFFIPLPVTMIGNASTSFDGSLYIYAPGAAGQAVTSLGATAYTCGNGMIFTAQVGSGITLSRGGGYVLRVDRNSKLIFSAE